MAAFRSFEEVDAWKKSRELVREIYLVSGNGDFRKDFVLRDQIRRASLSAMSNIAEGFERGGNKEFVQFLSVAKASAGEVRSQLYAAIDQGYLTQPEFDKLSRLVTKVSQIISGLISYLQKSDKKGVKFR